MIFEVEPDWWKTLFDEVYLLTDARTVCDRDLTSREIDLFLNLLPVSPRHKILDLCGGHGRHSLELCRRGFDRCTVLDYSAELINHGISTANDHKYQIKFIQADARDTGLNSETYDHVLIMGNSLGYSPDSKTDQEILQEAWRLLCHGGWLLIDTAEGSKIKSDFTPNSWHEIGQDTIVCRERKLTGNTIKTREMVISKQDGIIRDLVYSIKLYESETLTEMTTQAGFKDAQAFTAISLNKIHGDYGLMNNRMVITAQKP